MGVRTPCPPPPPSGYTHETSVEAHKFEYYVMQPDSGGGGGYKTFFVSILSVHEIPIAH